MPSAVLKIEGDTSGLARALGDVRAQAKATEKALAEAFKNAGKAGEESMTKVERISARLAAQQQRAAKQKEQADRRAYNEAERMAQRTVMSYVRAQEQQRRAARATAQVREKAEKESTAIAAAEARKRGLTAEQEARVRQTALERLTKSYEAAERRQTVITRRETRERERIERRQQAEQRTSGRAIAQVAQGAAGATSSAAHEAHTQIQDARGRRAAQEVAMNNILLQLVPSGATAGEVSGMRGQILAGARRMRLDPDSVIEAIGGAQSFANALGGDTPQARQANLQATMSDVDFASTVDPTSMGGLVRVGALTRGKMGDRDRHDLLRSFAGIGFQGSVETDQMITRGLPGLMEAWSTGTSGVSDPAEASRRRLEIAQDFAAQVQSQAASGRSVGVAANRTNTVRNAMQNEHRQDQLGQAFAARQATMTPEQRAAFSGAFTRGANGRYTMNESVSGRASDTAKFFGTMFNNNAGQMRNFLGAHGGGGAHQLMNRPDVDAVASYFGMATNSAGQSVRQYDYVNELAQSTITPEAEATMRQVREAEDQKNLNAAAQDHDDALTDNTNMLVKLSNEIANWTTANPLQTTALTAGGSFLAGTIGPKIAERAGTWLAGTGVGRMLGMGGEAAAGASGGAAKVALGGAARTGVRGLLGRIGGAVFGVPGMLAAGLSAIGAYGGTEQEDVERQRREGAEWERQSTRLTGEASAAHRPPPTAAEIGAAVHAALTAAPLTATVAPMDAAQAASRAPAPGR